MLDEAGVVPGRQYLSSFAFAAGGGTGLASGEGAAKDSLQARHEPTNRPAGAPSVTVRPRRRGRAIADPASAASRYETATRGAPFVRPIQERSARSPKCSLKMR